jgi:DNA-binding LacI/PurR family transcriptional regulator
MARTHAQIMDFARKAGVSVTTVSWVVNGQRYVRPEIRQRVQHAITELRYSSNFMARSLVWQKTNLVGVIVSNITTSFFSTIFSFIEETASADGYNIQFAVSLTGQLDEVGQVCPSCNVRGGIDCLASRTCDTAGKSLKPIRPARSEHELRATSREE